MKRKLSYITTLFATIILGVAFVGSASAYTFNQNNIIDDGVFDKQSMSAGDIDAWLNGFANSCISSNSGFRAIDPIGYNPSNGYQYGGFVTAGQVIFDASQAYSINPQVILTTLEKEQSLVSGRNNFSGYCNNGDQHKYAAAAGYGCPDSGTTYSYDNVNLYQRWGITISQTGTTCVNTSIKAGFTQQVIRAAWLLKFGEQRSEGHISWAVIKGNWDNSDDPQTCYGGPMTQGTFARCPSGGSTPYDGYYTIDSTAVHMDNGPTAALYWYTPHFAGNQNFFSIFTGWFGSTITPSYAAQPVWQSVFTDSTKATSLGWGATLYPGQTAYAVVQMKNTGNVTWTKSGGPGTTDTRLATYGPWGRQSALCTSGWIATSPTCTRPAGLTEVSVAPGQTGTFEFPITAPSQAGTYNEAFGLVVDGKATFSSGVATFPITVTQIYNSAQPVWQSVFTDSTKTTSLGWNATLLPGQTAYAVVQMKNTGNFYWTKSGGVNDAMIGTVLPQDRKSAFCTAAWLSPCNRPAVLTESSVAPGAVGTFQFPITAPSQTGTYNENFGLVVNGRGYFPSQYMNFQFTVVPPSYSAQPVWQSVFTDSTKTTSLGWNATLTHGQSAYAVVLMKNTGSVTWTRSGGIGTTDTRLATYVPWGRQSIFCTSGWIVTSPTCLRPAMLTETSVAPGQTGTFQFPIIAPSQAGTYNEAFGLVVDGKTTFSGGVANFQFTVH